MLNEIYLVYKGLKSIGELPNIKHNDIKEPGKNNITFRVLLDGDGCVSSVKLMAKEQIENCWSLGNKQTQFPAVKVKYPLIDGAHKKYNEWKKSNKRPNADGYRKLIEDLAQQFLSPIKHKAMWPDYREQILARKEQLAGNDLCSEVYELFDRYSKSENGIDILEQVRKQLICNTTQESDVKSLKATCDLLFGEKLKANGNEVEDSKRVTLLLDCFPRTDIDIYASSRNYVDSLSQALFEPESKENANSRIGKCALSNADCSLIDGTFPEEKLAVVGPTILFAKNEETSGATVERYGRSKGGAFPLSEELSQHLAASISFITSDKYKDKTWSKLPSSSLLLAYCKEDFDLPVTPLITGESEVEDFDDYLDATDSVIATFKGRLLSLDSVVDFVEIIKVDKANRKVNFSTSARISRLIKSAEEWKQACRNIPYFKLYTQLENSKKQMCSPWPISPQKVMLLSRQKYIRKGDESTTLPGIGFSDAMKLFLGKNNENLAMRFLLQISEQYQPLLRRCALSRQQSFLPADKIHLKSNPKLNAQALSVVTLMSILLFKMGRTKENYMKDFAFQLGQLCSAMDELHVGYCVSERGGSIPNTLLGNQVYGMALQNPKKALAFMATRRRPYDSWVRRTMAKGRSTDEKTIKNAVFSHIWMNKNAEPLSELLSANNPINSDTYKAELMLGYLAGRPFEQKNESIEKNQGDN